MKLRNSTPWLIKVFIRLLVKTLFNNILKRKVKKLAEESQKRLYPDNWIATFVEGDGKEFDFGIDYTQCGIVNFLHDQGAPELAPYMCLLDFPHSRLTRTGLVRTMTIAEGYKKCDFRFKKGREVKQDWPPNFHQIS